MASHCSTLAWRIPWTEHSPWDSIESDTTVQLCSVQWTSLRLPRWLSSKKFACHCMTLVVNNSPAKAGDLRDVDSISGLGRSPGGGTGKPLQYSYLGNSMDRGAWQATVHRVTKSQTWLSVSACTHTHTHKRASLHVLNKKQFWNWTVVLFQLDTPSKITDNVGAQCKSKIYYNKNFQE